MTIMSAVLSTVISFSNICLGYGYVASIDVDNPPHFITVYCDKNGDGIPEVALSAPYAWSSPRPYPKECREKLVVEGGQLKAFDTGVLGPQYRYYTEIGFTHIRMMKPGSKWEKLE